ncbi:MAG: 50S ribosomal protein L15 [Rhodothermales bacterium]|nr:50S ribosomal protein L15 [Rhodothermales bacterium]
MDLSNLKAAEGATRKRKRIARGIGSGRGGHTTGKGHKGQKSRSGASIPAWFEGGQMPLQRRVPKFGFKNRFRKEFLGVNLSRIADLIKAGRIEEGADVTPTLLVELGVIKSADRIKILGSGDISSALNVSAHAFSESARTKIEAAGGTVSVVE